MRSICPQGAAVVRTGSNFWTSLVSVATIFIYTPHKVYVRCRAGGVATAPAAG